MKAIDMETFVREIRLKRSRGYLYTVHVLVYVVMMKVERVQVEITIERFIIDKSDYHTFW